MGSRGPVGFVWDDVAVGGVGEHFLKRSRNVGFPYEKQYARVVKQVDTRDLKSGVTLGEVAGWWDCGELWPVLVPHT